MLDFGRLHFILVTVISFRHWRRQHYVPNVNLDAQLSTNSL